MKKIILPIVFSLFISTIFAQHEIVEGENATIENFPWQVSVESSFSEEDLFAHNCGGTIINESWILTAGHCVFATEIYKFRVRAGIDNLTDTEGQIVEVDSVYLHPSYIVLGRKSATAYQFYDSVKIYS